MAQKRTTDIQLNTLQELLQIGAARASDALRMFIRRPTAIHLTSVITRPLGQVATLLWPLDVERIVVYVPIQGTMGGHFFVVMTEEAAAKLAGYGGITGDGDEMRVSFFEEIANVVANNYLRSIEPYVGPAGQQDIPSYVEGLPETIFDGIIAELEIAEGTVIVGRTECVVEKECIDLEFWWFFNANELGVLWKRLDDLAGGRDDRG